MTACTEVARCSTSPCLLILTRHVGILHLDIFTPPSVQVIVPNHHQNLVQLLLNLSRLHPGVASFGFSNRFHFQHWKYEEMKTEKSTDRFFLPSHETCHDKVVRIIKTTERIQESALYRLIGAH